MDEQARAALDGHAPPSTEIIAPARAVGRPSTFNEEIARKVLDLIAEGASFRKIGRMEGFPGRTTLFRWCREHQEFAQDYAMALQWRTEGRIDQMVEIATQTDDDWELREINSETGQSRLEFKKDAVSRSELGVKTLQWIVERENPQKYGPFEHRGIQRAPDSTAAPIDNGEGAKELNPRAPTRQIIEATAITDPCAAALNACANAAKAALPGS